MKKLLLMTLLLMFCISANAQVKDTTINNIKKVFDDDGSLQKLDTIVEHDTIKTVSLTSEIILIKNDLVQAHKEYQIGTGFIISGTSLIGIGSLIEYIRSTSTSSGTNPGIYLIGIGGLSNVIGYLIQIDSHKWIGRAGIGLGGNGIILKYKLN